MEFLQNPIILGAIASLIVWAIRKLGRGQQSAIGITISVATAIAIVERLWQTRLSDQAVNAMVVELERFLNTLWPVARSLIADAGAIFVSAQAIYHVLNIEIANKVKRSVVQVLTFSAKGWAWAIGYEIKKKDGDLK